MKLNRFLLLMALTLVQLGGISAQVVDRIEVKRDTVICENNDTLINITYKEQTKVERKELDENESRFVSNGRKENWFVGGELGIQKYCGEEDNKNGFFSNLTPTARVSVGKWLFPFVALRADVSYQSAKGYTTLPDVSNYITGDKNSKGLYAQKWDYLSYGADVMFSLQDLFGQYKRDRKNKYVLFAGVVRNTSLKSCNNSEAKHSASVDYGFEYHRRIANNWDLTASARMDIYNKSFDDEQTSHYFEFSTAINVGFVWYIPTKRKTRGWNKIGDNDVDTYNIYRSLQERHLYSSAGVDKDYIHPVAVFFVINKWEVRPEYEFTLETVAKEIKRTKSKFILFGSADSATGNDSINTYLAENRCKSVYDKLVNKYGVNPEQLVQKPLGGVDTYNTKHLNRCVIVVQDEAKAIQAIKDLNDEKKF